MAISMKNLKPKRDKSHFYVFFCSLILLSQTILPSFAHHPWESSFSNMNLFEGFLSGLAHPVFGLDHLVFLFSIGLIGLISSGMSIYLFLGIGLLGSFISQVLPIFSGAEIIIALTVVISAFVAAGKLNKMIMLPFVFCHGYVLGNAIIGIESSPMIGYFLGLLTIQSILIYIGSLCFSFYLNNKLLISSFLFGIGLIITTSIIA